MLFSYAGMLRHGNGFWMKRIACCALTFAFYLDTMRVPGNFGDHFLMQRKSFRKWPPKLFDSL
jgi:hypothetical protein